MKRAMPVFTTVLMSSLILAASGFSQTTDTDTAYVPVVVNVADVEGGDVTNLPVSLKVQSPNGGERTYQLQAGKQETLALPLAGFSSVSYRPPKQANAPTTVSHRRGKVTLRLNPEQFRSADISLLSINGKWVWRGKADASKSAQSVSLPNIAAGVYLLSVKGINGNTFASKLTHTGGRLSINTVFAGVDVSTLRKGAFSANKTWTMTASTAFHNEVSRGFTPVSGTNEKIEITLSTVSEYVIIYKAEWDLVEKSAHDDEETARANTANMQRAIDHFYAQGHRKMRLEKMDITVWGAHPTGASSWSGMETRNNETGIVMRTGMSFDMNGSIFRLATSERPRSTIIMIGVPHTDIASGYGNVFDEPNPKINTWGEVVTTDVEIFNGTLIGDRNTHDYTKLVSDGNPKTVSSHEWGKGIYIGSNTQYVKVYNMVVKDVTGDCISVEGKDHRIFNNVISGGRRNGICSAAGWRGPSTGVKIYGNTIFDIYNDVVIPGLTHNQSGRSEYQRENGITYGIGAQACIAFEGSNYMSFEIYDNYLDGRSDSPWDFGDPISFHWGSMGMYIRDNIIKGSIYFNCGNNIIVERNKFFNGGIHISASGATYNIDLGGERTGRSDLRNVIVLDNYFLDGYVYLSGGTASQAVGEVGQVGPANVAFIANHFVNSTAGLHNSIRTAFVGNVFNATTRAGNQAVTVYSQNPPQTEGSFVYAFVGDLVQIIENGTWNGDTPGWRRVRYYQYGEIFEPREIRQNGVIITDEQANESSFPWYRETDDPQKVTEFLQGFITKGPDELPLYTNWHTEFMKTHAKYYTINNDKKDLPLYNGGALPSGYTPPYTLESELQKFYERAGHKNPQL